MVKSTLSSREIPRAEPEGQKGSPSPPVPGKPSILYSSGRFVDMVC